MLRFPQKRERCHPERSAALDSAFALLGAASQFGYGHPPFAQNDGAARRGGKCGDHQRWWKESAKKADGNNDCCLSKRLKALRQATF